MLEINKMKNFYGIKSLKLVNCKFEKMNVIFSPNGTFKTSFFNGFENIKEENEAAILDRLTNQKAEYDIKYIGETIKPSDIITFNNNILNSVNNFDIFYFEMDKELIKSRDILASFIGFFSSVQDKEKFIGEGNKVLKYLEWVDIVVNSEEYKKFSKEYEKIRSNKEFIKFDYNTAKKAGIFDENVQENIRNILVTRKVQLDLLRDNFHISDILNSLDFLEKYFQVGHIMKIKTLDNNYIEITSYEQFNEFFENEKVLIDQHIKRDNIDYQTLDKTLSNNKVNRDIKERLLEEISLLEYFEYDELFYFLFEIERQLSKFNSVHIREAYKSLKNSSDNYDKEFFKESLKKFNQRFFNHFELELVENNDDDLGFSTPKVICKLHGVETNAEKLLNIMSKGERNACSLFLLLHQIEKVKETNKILLIDDEMEVFDYAYKHSFLEYLAEIAETNLNVIILSHNYDFLRSIDSRIGTCNKMVAYKNDQQHITINHISTFRQIKNGILNDVKERYIITALAARRNMMELSGNDISHITKFFHLKEGTEELILSDVEEFISLDNSVKTKEENYISWLQRNAAKIANDYKGSSNFLLDEKVILALAIRMKFEKIFKTREHNQNQTREIFNELPEEVRSQFFEINIIVPDFIHLNTFAYEPLMDIKIDRMINLYKKILEYENLISAT